MSRAKNLPRIFQPGPVRPGTPVSLHETAARHVQVLRMQPGHHLILFDGLGGQYLAQVLEMGRASVSVQVVAYEAVEREASTAVHLWVGVPANERMDWLVEKATELGVASMTPILTERVVLRLQGDRAEKRRAHWQAIAVAACEQCGRNRVPVIRPLCSLGEALTLLEDPAWHACQRWMLSFRPESSVLEGFAGGSSVICLSGPEGGLTEREEELAVTAGFSPMSLGARVLRAETAALLALARLAD
jgi:16S rRNA (uracil1498-N3)-methyltransferase